MVFSYVPTLFGSTEYSATHDLPTPKTLTMCYYVMYSGSIFIRISMVGLIISMCIYHIVICLYLYQGSGISKYYCNIMTMWLTKLT